MNLVYLHNVAHWLYRKKIPIIPKIIYYIQFLLFNSSVPFQVKIGKNTKFGYGCIGVVIHANTEIGQDCIIGQGVTIGGRSKICEVPKIGNRVYIGPGARVLGNVVIGDDVVIGANAVVIKDVPSGCIVVGIPAKIIKEGIRMKDYV
ncbi:serine O-acetyltransferase [Sulfurovum sp.]|jgi:serine O-acetyltransferase|uniref:serine O-acetyltransferase n=1 Tax=Sulfurovum sp. TaxID=1969726 RepID=UPI002A361160|nr:serine O-acetyltransferase [Sulfurovum sp.]MDY0402781.1 serine O-acetyltransferase [Sulfurovum sp.]